MLAKLSTLPVRTQIVHDGALAYVRPTHERHLHPVFDETALLSGSEVSVYISH